MTLNKKDIVVAVNESTVVQLVRSLARMLKLIFTFRILLRGIC